MHISVTFWGGGGGRETQRLKKFIFYSLEVVSRYRDPQLQKCLYILHMYLYKYKL